MSAALLIGHSSTPTSPAIFSPSHVSFHVLLTVANHNKVHPESSSLLIHVNKLVHVRHYDMWLKDTSQTPFGKFSKSFNNNKQQDKQAFTVSRMQQKEMPFAEYLWCIGAAAYSHLIMTHNLPRESFPFEAEEHAILFTIKVFCLLSLQLQTNWLAKIRSCRCSAIIIQMRESLSCAEDCRK